VVISTYVPYELYEKVKELARSKGKNISEVAYELIKRGLEAGNASATDPPDPPDALQNVLKTLEPLDRERVIQFMKELEEAEGRLAKLSHDELKLARAGRISSGEAVGLRKTVIDLRHTYERIIKRSVRNPDVLDIIGERLLELMKELGVPV
jgi:integrase